MTPAPLQGFSLEQRSGGHPRRGDPL